MHTFQDAVDEIGRVQDARGRFHYLGEAKDKHKDFLESLDRRQLISRIMEAVSYSETRLYDSKKGDKLYSSNEDIIRYMQKELIGE